MLLESFPTLYDVSHAHDSRWHGMLVHFVWYWVYRPPQRRRVVVELKAHSPFTRLPLIVLDEAITVVVKLVVVVVRSESVWLALARAAAEPAGAACQAVVEVLSEVE